MERTIYQDIAQRTDGNVYIGVVGPVRSGKSTFIKRFMDTLVLPHIDNEFRKERATDELPQSAAGRTIMTTEPKFIPEEAAAITLDGGAAVRVRMIDCVGYVVPSALGYIENEQPRMVATPWFEEEIPFNLAAEIGTRKVITEHATIGLVVTTDGSVSDIPREEYAEAEQRVIGELQQLGKPFIVLLNCLHPASDDARALAAELTARYGVPVRPVNCLELEEEAIRGLLGDLLMEFPVRQITLHMPGWLSALAPDHWLRSELREQVRRLAGPLRHVRELAALADGLAEGEQVETAAVTAIQLGEGSADIDLRPRQDLFYRVVAETTGLAIDGERDLLTRLIELADTRRRFERVKDALDQVEATGYGIVMPSIEELSLEEPEIVKQGGQYGVRLKAAAPSIHMMKATIQTEIAPTVGSEKQSEDLVKYLLAEFEEDTLKIWDSNIFGKSLHDLMTEGLHAKLNHMPADARSKLQETLERVINEGCTGLICIIL